MCYRRALLLNGNLIVNRFCCGTQTAQGTEEKEEEEGKKEASQLIIVVHVLRLLLLVKNYTQL